MAIFNQPFLSGGFPSMNRAAAGAVGGWVELGRTTLGSAGSTITVSGLSNKRYYMVLTHGLWSSGNQWVNPRLGNGSVDTGTNYSWRHSDSGAVDATGTSSNFMGYIAPTGGAGGNRFAVNYLSNYSTKEKLSIAHGIESQGTSATTAPTRIENVGKWTNTSNPLDVYQIHNGGRTNFQTGSEVVVLGWDPDDTHTNNFWEELDSKTQTSDATTFNSNTFTNKKYLWIQAWIDVDGAYQLGLRFNSDSTSSYATRYNDNGAGDGALTSQTSIQSSNSSSVPRFLNMFVVNDGTNEPLVIGHVVDVESAGAGTAPRRREFVGKLDTTTAITSVNFFKRTGAGTNIVQNSILKVWGAN